MDLVMINNKNELTTEARVREYVNGVFETVKLRNPHEEEFHQAVKVLFDSLIPVLVKNPQYIKHSIIERLAEPERLISFQVPWVDDQGKVQVNRGYRVQFNNAIGPYKGGIRFHPSVSASIIKFLGFQQTIKNSLSGQAIGGAKGGADFDPKGKSDLEIMRFCQSFMMELSKYIGPDLDIPAGDIGVGAKEVGYMFGQYKRIRGSFEAGVLTGKGLSYGGSIGRTEATGFGTVYFVEEMLKDNDLSLKDSTVVVSGSGNVSIYAMEKAIQLGAKVVACSDSDGYIHDPQGLDLETVKQIKLVDGGRINEYIDTHPEATYVADYTGIWTIPCDIALPCATQNELDEVAAQTLVKNGVRLVAEGANMPSTLEAINYFLENDILFGPSQAVNAGGVAVSSLEMAQNSARVAWSFEKVDQKLHQIMKNIYQTCIEASKEYGSPGNLVIGMNIAGFKKIADTMIIHGVV